jgi:hypothetical protein
MLPDRQQLRVQDVGDRHKEVRAEVDRGRRLVPEDGREVSAGGTDELGSRSMILMGVDWGRPEGDVSIAYDVRQPLESHAIVRHVREAQPRDVGVVVSRGPRLLEASRNRVAAGGTVRHDDDLDVMAGPRSADEEAAAADLDVVRVRGNGDDAHRPEDTPRG